MTRTRLYLETMAEVIPRAEQRVFIDEGLKGLLPLLSLDRKGGGPSSQEGTP